MERKRRISAPFLRTGLNNYRQSKTAAQPENTIIAFIQAEIADNIFSPIKLRFPNLCRKNGGAIMISPIGIVLVQFRFDPVLICDDCLLAVITYDQCRYATEIIKGMVIDFDPLWLLC